MSKLVALSRLEFMTTGGRVSYNLCNKPETVIQALNAARKDGEPRIFIGENGESYVIDPSDFLGGFVVFDLNVLRKREKEVEVQDEPIFPNNIEQAWHYVRESIEKSLVQQAEFLRNLHAEFSSSPVDMEEEFWKVFHEWVELYATVANPEHVSIVRQFFNWAYAENHSGRSWEDDHPTPETVEENNEETDESLSGPIPQSI